MTLPTSASASRRSWGVFDLADLETRIRQLDEEASQPGFWDEPQRAQRKMRDLAAMRSEHETWSDINSRTANLQDLAELAVDESDSEMAGQLRAEYEQLTDMVNELEFDLQLNGEYDERPAILGVKAGAGGVDAQDWAEMLVRMYTRWAERRKFGVEILEETPGEEAGLKSATLRIDGRFAYGYLRSERGVHRLVRLSPFDSEHRRHTSFALVEALPEPDEAEEVTIDPDDLRIDIYRASGHGGQNVQKNSTAVRLTHIPTGIVVAVQNERSQAQNKDVAMRILLARLIDVDRQKKEEERLKLKGEHVSAEFGRQVRSYVLHPYQMVKDHRTEHEESDALAVLDGDFDPFLKAYLAAEVGGAPVAGD